MTAKPPTTIDQQIKILESRGLIIGDKSIAAKRLSHANYFRLCCYNKPLLAHDSERFIPGSTFELLWAIYSFDRHLRMHLLDAIERCEISFRTTWAYELAHLHGPQAYENNAIFKDQAKYQETMVKVDEEIKRSREDYILSHQTPGAVRPPIWMACEVISLGHLSSLFANLASASDRNAIASKYALDEKNVKSFLHHLTIVRNLCAHHCRIWDRRFTLIFQLPRKKPPGLLANFNEAEPRRIYNSLVMLAYWLDIADLGNHWAKKIVALLENDAFPFTSHMGFPPDWRDRPIWKLP